MLNMIDAPPDKEVPGGRITYYVLIVVSVNNYRLIGLYYVADFTGYFTGFAMCTPVLVVYLHSSQDCVDLQVVGTCSFPY